MNLLQHSLDEEIKTLNKEYKKRNIEITKDSCTHSVTIDQALDILFEGLRNYDNRPYTRSFICPLINDYQQYLNIRYFKKYNVSYKIKSLFDC